MAKEYSLLYGLLSPTLDPIWLVVNRFMIGRKRTVAL